MQMSLRDLSLPSLISRAKYVSRHARRILIFRNVSVSSLFRFEEHELASVSASTQSHPVVPAGPPRRPLDQSARCCSDVLVRLRAPPAAPALQAHSEPKSQVRLRARPDPSPEPCPGRARGRRRTGRRAFAAVQLRLPRAEAGA